MPSLSIYLPEPFLDSHQHNYISTPLRHFSTRWVILSPKCLFLSTLVPIFVTHPRKQRNRPLVIFFFFLQTKKIIGNYKVAEKVALLYIS